jgi:phage-related holin
MTRLIDSIRNAFEEWVNHCYSFTEVIQEYDMFVESIINPYFGEEYYNTTSYPEFIKSRVIDLLLCWIRESAYFSINVFYDGLDMARRVDMFNAVTVTSLIDALVERTGTQSCALIFDDTPINETSHVSLFQFWMNEIRTLGVNIASLLRFIIIQQLKNETDNSVLLLKKMLYQKYSEIPIQNYICALLATRKVEFIDEILYIYGFDDIVKCDNPAYSIDKYYLSNLQNIYI